MTTVYHQTVMGFFRLIYRTKTVGLCPTTLQAFLVRKFASQIGMVRIFATQKRLRRPVSSGSLTAAFIFAVP